VNKAICLMDITDFTVSCTHMITEDQLEQLCPDWFKGMDYEYVWLQRSTRQHNPESQDVAIET
jgi:hypothetical protein